MSFGDEGDQVPLVNGVIHHYIGFSIFDPNAPVVPDSENLLWHASNVRPGIWQSVKGLYTAGVAWFGLGRKADG